MAGVDGACDSALRRWRRGGRAAVRGGHRSPPWLARVHPMFDRVAARPRSPRWRTAAIIGTTAGHAAVLSALVVTAFWKIDRLPVADHTDVRVAATMQLPPPGGPPPGERLRTMRVPAKVKPPVPVQPEKLAPLVPVPTGPATPSTGPSGEGPGGGGDNPGGDPDSTLTGSGTCAVPPCGPPERPQPQPPATDATVKPPPIVPPSVAKGLRLSGDDQLAPSDPVRLAIARDGKDQVRGTFKVCVGADGAVDAVHVLASTGYPAYDGELVQRMCAWAYRPYRVNGAPAPMCTVSMVVFRLTR